MYTLKWPPLIKIEINHYEVQRQDKLRKKTANIFLQTRLHNF